MCLAGLEEDSLPSTLQQLQHGNQLACADKHQHACLTQRVARGLAAWQQAVDRLVLFALLIHLISPHILLVVVARTAAACEDPTRALSLPAQHVERDRQVTALASPLLLPFIYREP